jgi:hypothetical protein
MSREWRDARLGLEDAMAKRFRCYLRSHRWVQKFSAGLFYYECRDCGKYRDPIQTPLPILWGRSSKRPDD